MAMFPSLRTMFGFPVKSSSVELNSEETPQKVIEDVFNDKTIPMYKSVAPLVAHICVANPTISTKQIGVMLSCAGLTGAAGESLMEEANAEYFMRAIRDYTDFPKLVLNLNQAQLVARNNAITESTKSLKSSIETQKVMIDELRAELDKRREYAKKLETESAELQKQVDEFRATPQIDAVLNKAVESKAEAKSYAVTDEVIEKMYLEIEQYVEESIERLDDESFLSALVETFFHECCRVSTINKEICDIITRNARYRASEVRVYMPDYAARFDKTVEDDSIRHALNILIQVMFIENMDAAKLGHIVNTIGSVYRNRNHSSIFRALSHMVLGKRRNSLKVVKSVSVTTTDAKENVQIKALAESLNLSVHSVHMVLTCSLLRQMELQESENQ